jgi:hypothetical protein
MLILLAEIITKKGPYKYCEEKINAVNNKVAIFRPNEKFIITREYYISG